MDINAMHNAFRALGNQVGMQRVRGITPECIDIFLNSEISEYIKDNIIQGVLTSNSEKGTGSNSMVGPINILRTLIRTREIKLGNYKTENVGHINKINDSNIQVYIPVSSNAVNKYSSLSNDEKSKIKIDPMLYISCAIKYANSSGIYGIDNKVSSRIVASDIIETALNDSSNKSTPENPIVSLMCDDDGLPYFDIYIGSSKPVIESIIIKYIKTPQEVSIGDSTASPVIKGVDCDLPDYTHFDIVKRAVQSYLTSIGSIGNKSNNESNKE